VFALTFSPSKRGRIPLSLVRNNMEISQGGIEGVKQRGEQVAVAQGMLARKKHRLGLKTTGHLAQAF